ncbi:MAG: hypothetical protein AMS20_09345 [Gemmatimonas sp. SG8_28]|nr:MAG: hypothetical protein AMS20_09345 [Gemmatimonas sp. SG8_28]
MPNPPARARAAGGNTDVRFGGGTPIFPVRSPAAGMDHYTRVLGVAVDWEFHGVFASVSRGKVSLFLPRIPTATCFGSARIRLPANPRASGSICMGRCWARARTTIRKAASTTDSRRQ